MDTPDKYKYPRTFHFPWSLGASADDKIGDPETLSGMEVVVTEKLDGENSTIYHGGYCHARSMDSAHHPSRSWLKKFAEQIGRDIPDGCRICGENMFAKHSIAYEALPSYFLGFSMWKGETCLSWGETEEYFDLLGVTPVPVLYRGRFDENSVKSLAENLDSRRQEGIVVRNAGEFHLGDFQENVLKYVRQGHVQTEEHWMHGPVVSNCLAPATKDGQTKPLGVPKFSPPGAGLIPSSAFRARAR